MRRVLLMIQILGWPVLVAVALTVPTGDMRDAHTFYTVALHDPYAHSVYWQTGYVYSPAFALFVQPFQLLSEPAFYFLVRCVSAIALGYLVTPWMGALLITTGAPGVGPELGVGNIDLIVGAALVWAFRWPAAWSLLLLTKVTPMVGLLWYAARREWRALAVVAAATTAIVLVSLPFTFGSWFAWVGVLTGDNIGIADQLAPIPLFVRGLLAAALTVYAALTDRIWLVPIAIVISFPAPNAPHWLVALAAFRLAWRQREQHDFVGA